jgi:hypothetical protein
VLVKVSSLQFASLSLLAVLLYYVLKDYKIILAGVKETRHIMSETVIALRQALTPIKYTYPVIATSLSEEHRDYIDAPLPSILMLWGSKSACRELSAQRRRILEKNSSFEIPAVLVDLNEKVVVGPQPSPEES